MKTTRKFLRLTALLLVLMLVIPTMLSACGKKKEPGGSEETKVNSTPSGTEGPDESGMEAYLLSAYDKMEKLSAGKLTVSQESCETRGKESRRRSYISAFDFAVDASGKFKALGTASNQFGEAMIEQYLQDNVSYAHDLEDSTYEYTEYVKSQTLGTLLSDLFAKSNLFTDDYASLVKSFVKLDHTKKTDAAGTVYSFEAPVSEFLNAFDTHEDFVENAVYIMEEYKAYEDKASLSFTVTKNGILTAVDMSVGVTGEFVSMYSGFSVCVSQQIGNASVNAPAWIANATVTDEPGGRFNDDRVVLLAGEEYDIFDYITVYNAKEVTLSSSNDAVLTILKDGKFKIAESAAHKSTVELTVLLKGSGGEGSIQETLSIVAAEPVIEFSGDALYVNCMERTDDIADIYGADSVSYKSSDETILKIDAMGTVRPLKEGTVTVTVTATNRFGTKTEEKTVRVVGEKPEIYEGYGSTMCVGYLTRCFNGVDYADTVTITVSDESVLKVDGYGFALGLKKGSATVTVTAKNAYGESTYEREITVVEVKPTLRSYLDDEGVIMNAGTAHDLYYDLSMSTYESVTYESSDPSVVTVSENGYLRAIKKGSADIHVTVKNAFGKTELSFTVTVMQDAPKIDLYDNEITVDGGQGEYCVADHFYVSLAQQITYKSSDESVLTVLPNGVITAYKNGTATVTINATNEFGSSIATVKVYVDYIKPEIDGFDWVTPTLNVGESCYAYNWLSVHYASKTTFTSSDETIATVSNYGDVTAYKKGKVTITVTAENLSGKTTYSFELTVTADKPVIDVYENKIKMMAGDEADVWSLLSVYYVDGPITCTSSDESIVRIDGDTLFCLKKGTATITVTATNSFGSTTATFTVTVLETAPELSVWDITTYVGDWRSANSYMDVLYADTVTVTSSDDSIAYTDVDNWICGAKIGTVTVTVTATNRFGSVTESFTLTVIDPYGGDSEEPPFFAIENGEVCVVNKNEWFILPEYVYDHDSLTIEISDTSIVWADTDDWLYGENYGTVTVTVTATNEFGSTTVTFTLEVTYEQDTWESAPIIDLPNGDTTYGELGDSAAISLFVQLYDTLNVTSSDESVVAVDNDNVITCVGVGSAEITVVAVNQYGTTTVTITVIVE